MSKTIKYIGPQKRWSELSTTGNQSTWLMSGQMEERSDAEAALLLATGLFSDVSAIQLSDAKRTAVSSLVSGSASWVLNADIQQYNPLRFKLEDFSRFNTWTVNNTTHGAISAATPSELYPYGGGIRFQSTGGGTDSPNCYKELGINGVSDGLVLSAATGFWLLVDQRDPTADGQSVNLNLAFFHSAFGSGSDYLHCTAVGPALSVSAQPRWLPKSVFTAVGTGSWSNALKSIRIRHDGQSGIARDVVLAGLWTQGKRPTCIFTFDDGWVESYTLGFAEAQKRGIPLTHFLIPELLGGANYITLAQANAMKAAGDYLGLHGNARWDTDPTNIALQISRCRELGIDVQHASIPEGKYGDTFATWQEIRQKFIDGGVKTARLTSAAGANHFPVFLHGIGDPYALTGRGAINNTNANALTDAKGSIDAAIASGGTVMFYFHRIGANADSLYLDAAVYKQILDYVYIKRIEGSLDITTIDRWYTGDY